MRRAVAWSRSGKRYDGTARGREPQGAESGDGVAGAVGQDARRRGQRAAHPRCCAFRARDYPEASRLFAIEVMRGAPVLKDVLSGELKVLVDRKVTLLRRWMAQGRLARRDPHHLIFMIWATTQHYADFSTQVEAITERTLHHPGFFAAARQSILDAVLGPKPV
jgi:hypothetical protein